MQWVLDAGREDLPPLPLRERKTEVEGDILPTTEVDTERVEVEGVRGRGEGGGNRIWICRRTL